eukprot:10166956-Alexandrium_andersonii.AAC.1
MTVARTTAGGCRNSISMAHSSSRRGTSAASCATTLFVSSQATTRSELANPASAIAPARRMRCAGAR